MGKEWDSHPDPSAYQTWCQQWATECLRVLKPGGYLLAFGGTRTYHRLACAIEDAGFEIRDSLMWLYGQGFPKSLDVGKAINKAAVASEAARWDGWGTALKPAHEPVVVARKPLVGTVAANVLTHGTGALNIDACRIAYVSEEDRPTQDAWNRMGSSGSAGANGYAEQFTQGMKDAYRDGAIPVPSGRWPANIVLSHADGCRPTGTVTEVTGGGARGTSGFAGGYERGDGYAGREVTSTRWTCEPGCPVPELDAQSGPSSSRKGRPRSGSRKDGEVFGPKASGFNGEVGPEYDDQGGASRFFYCAKASKSERPSVEVGGRMVLHPTVKPLALMRWLVRLVTPPGGLVLDPFLGSGTTAEACVLERMRCLGIEREAEYLSLVEQRLERMRTPDGTEAHGGRQAKR
jgi:site-specific DNA-methyltransferase (adenine-specific)